MSDPAILFLARFLCPSKSDCLLGKKEQLTLKSPNSESLHVLSELTDNGSRGIVCSSLAQAGLPQGLYF